MRFLMIAMLGLLVVAAMTSCPKPPADTTPDSGVTDSNMRTPDYNGGQTTPPATPPESTAPPAAPPEGGATTPPATPPEGGATPPATPPEGGATPPETPPATPPATPPPSGGK
jgi:hypothetical protein